MPQGLLDAAAIKEHVLLLGVAMEITEDLQWPNRGERNSWSGLLVSDLFKMSVSSGRYCLPSRTSHVGILGDSGKSGIGKVIRGKLVWKRLGTERDVRKYELLVALLRNVLVTGAETGSKLEEDIGPKAFKTIREFSTILKVNRKYPFKRNRLNTKKRS